MVTPLEACPYCGQAIASDRPEETRARIRREEQQRIAALEAETRKRLRQELEVEYIREVQAQKDAYKRLADERVASTEANFNREREALMKKILDLERRVAQKTPHELGEGPERDLEQVLRDEFPDDAIRRVPRGEMGADVVQDVRYKGETCGTIIYDSKNHKGWRSEFVTKLKADMIRHGATHAVVTAAAFPRGQDGFCVEDGVIVIDPRHVVHIAQILRANMVALHRQELSMQERDLKMVALYQYLGSRAFAARWNEITDLIAGLEQVDADEREAHNKVWKSRARGLMLMRAAVDDVGSRIAEIMERVDSDESGTLPAAG